MRLVIGRAGAPGVRAGGGRLQPPANAGRWEPPALGNARMRWASAVGRHCPLTISPPAVARCHEESEARYNEYAAVTTASAAYSLSIRNRLQLPCRDRAAREKPQHRQRRFGWFAMSARQNRRPRPAAGQQVCGYCGGNQLSSWHTRPHLSGTWYGWI